MKLIKAIIRLLKQKLKKKKNEDLFEELTTYKSSEEPYYDEEIFEYFWG